MLNFYSVPERVPISFCLISMLCLKDFLFHFAYFFASEIPYFFVLNFYDVHRGMRCVVYVMSTFGENIVFDTILHNMYICIVYTRIIYSNTSTCNDICMHRKLSCENIVGYVRICLIDIHQGY